MNPYDECDKPISHAHYVNYIASSKSCKSKENFGNK